MLNSKQRMMIRADEELREANKDYNIAIANVQKQIDSPDSIAPERRFMGKVLEYLKAKQIWLRG